MDLPNLIQPKKTLETWSGGSYYDIESRWFGITFCDDSFLFYYGKESPFIYILPWRNYHLVQRCLYDKEGILFYQQNIPKDRKFLDSWEEFYKMENICPSRIF